MNKPLTALIIEDDISIRTVLKNFLLINNFVVFEAYSLESAQLIIEKEKIDIILLDLRLGDEDGFLIFEQNKILDKSPEIIIMTGFSEQENILRALKLGARDFLQKPVNLDDLKKALERTFAFEQMRRRIKSLSKSVTFFQDELNKNYNLRIIGNSAKIIKVYELAKLAAESPDASVFITGQSGTGKELVARFIHNASSRKKKVFYAMNCSALPESLAESELFGHTKGAFTGAFENKTGCFEAADEGTLFLDEIGDMSLQAQAKILRVLEEYKIRKIGSHDEMPVNVRIISATNQNIMEMIEKKTFRNDLFFRLNTIQIDIPSLKERIEDIRPLMEYYIFFFAEKLNKKIKKIEDSVFEYLVDYDFPGNVRELKNIAERAVILCRNEIINLEVIGELESSNKQTKNQIIEKNISDNENINHFNLEEIEKNTILKALNYTKNNKSAAAELLNISRAALLRKIEKYKIT